jgi:hypothetical protein
MGGAWACRPIILVDWREAPRIFRRGGTSFGVFGVMVVITTLSGVNAPARLP